MSQNQQGSISRRELLKRAGLATTAATAAAGLLTGGALSQQQAEPTAEPTAVVNTLGGGDKKISVWDGLGGPDGETFAKMLKQFVEQNPDVQIQHETLDWSVYYQKVPTSILAGSPPDLLVNDAYGMPQFADRKMLRPLDDLIFGNKLLPKDDFSADELKLGTWNDHIYGIPLWNPIIGFWMNNDLVQKAGLDPKKPPMTGPEFAEWAVRLTTDKQGLHPDQKGFDPGKVEQYGVSMGWIFHSQLSTLWQFGGDITNADHTKCTLDAPESVQSLEYWVDLIKQHTHVPLVPPYVPATGTSYASNKLAMVVEGSWWLNYFNSENPKLKPPVTTMWELPQFGSKKSVWWTGHVMSIPAGGSDEKADTVAKLVAFLSDQTSWGAPEAGHLPARESQKDLPEVQKSWWLAPLAQQQREFGRLEWYSPDYNQIQNYYMAAWGSALTLQSSPQDALAQATKLIDGVLSR